MGERIPSQERTQTRAGSRREFCDKAVYFGASFFLATILGRVGIAQGQDSPETIGDPRIAQTLKQWYAADSGNRNDDNPHLQAIHDKLRGFERMYASDSFRKRRATDAKLHEYLAGQAWKTVYPFPPATMSLVHNSNPEFRHVVTRFMQNFHLPSGKSAPERKFLPGKVTANLPFHDLRDHGNLGVPVVIQPEAERILQQMVIEITEQENDVCVILTQILNASALSLSYGEIDGRHGIAFPKGNITLYEPEPGTDNVKFNTKEHANTNVLVGTGSWAERCPSCHLKVKKVSAKGVGGAEEEFAAMETFPDGAMLRNPDTGAIARWDEEHRAWTAIDEKVVAAKGEEIFEYRTIQGERHFFLNHVPYFLSMEAR